MKIAILTSGIMPVPAVQGGAVETLIDFYLDYNDRHRLHDITVYSVWHPNVGNHRAIKSEVNRYVYINTSCMTAKMKKFIYSRTHPSEYYHYTIEYFFEQAFRKLRKEDFDLIIVENRPGYILKLRKRTDTPCILHLHNDFLNKETKHSNEIFNGFNSIVSVSGYISKRVADINPIEAKKCATVYNAIDLCSFTQAHAAKRKDYGLTYTDFVIVYSGRLTQEKGIMQLIRAFKLLNDIPQPKLLIIGASAYGKDKHKTAFIKQLENESEQIKEHVVFTGFVDYSLVPSLLKMADVAVVPSMWEEPFGLTVIEAMAAGLPLITTHSGGIPEICENTAIIVDKEDVSHSIAAAILDLYNNPEKRKMMTQASMECSKHYDKETYAKHFFATIEESINKGQ